jgi:ribosomal protein S18 acetylase RimI-like enzyme
MQSDCKIEKITDKGDPLIEKTNLLFEEMYAFMQDHGLMLGLARDGARKWVEGIRQGLGRFGILFICLQQEEVIGFAHGALRLTPDYLGSKKVGVITHVYVREDIRKQGAGKALVKELEQWFDEKEVSSVELQVLTHNESAILFWESAGYQRELLQYRKLK